MSTEQSLQPGTRLSGGKFIIDRLIGRGGFSFIYEGRIIYQLDLDNDFVGLQAEEKAVIIKELYNKDYAIRTADGISLGWNDDNRPISERFSEKIKSKTRSEAIKLRNLRHPNILHIIGAVEENNTIYQITQKIEGAIDLAKKLGLGTEDAHGLPFAEARKYILQVAEALILVHRMNIIHLDIKPENILIDKDDKAILIDFGISMTLDSESNHQVSSIILNAASRPWAPVEQYSIIGRNSVGFESDIYALGQTIYALLTGIIPPDHTSILSGTATLVAPSEYNREVSDYIDHVICKCIEMKRSNRYQTIEDFVRAFNGEEDYQKLIAQAEDAIGRKLWAEAIALFNESESYIPLPYELQGKRNACIDFLTQQDIAQHLAEAKLSMKGGSYIEAKQKLSLLPATEEIRHLLQQCDEQLHIQHLAHLKEEANLSLAEGRYHEAEGLIEQILMLKADDSVAQALETELKADRELLRGLNYYQMRTGVDTGRRSRLKSLIINAEYVERLYGKALNLVGGEKAKRLENKLQSVRELIPQVNHYVDNLSKLTQLQCHIESELYLHLNDIKLCRSIYQTAYAPLYHTTEVQNFFQLLDQEEEIYRHLIGLIANGDTVIEGSKTETQRSQYRVLQKAVDWLAQQKGRELIINEIRQQLQLELDNLKAELQTSELQEQRRMFLSEVEALVSKQDFSALAVKLKSNEAGCLEASERQRYLSLIPKKPNLLWRILRWPLYITLGIIALLFAIGILSDGESDGSTYTDSVTVQTTEERISSDSTSSLINLDSATATPVIRNSRVEENELAKKIELLREEKLRKAKEDEVREQQREAAKLVQRANDHFDRRQLEEACELYIKANRLSKGSGNVGISRFETLAESLSDDKTAPAYRSAKERADRIRAAR